MNDDGARSTDDRVEPETHRNTGRAAIRVAGAGAVVVALCAVVGVASAARSTASVGDVPADTTALAGLAATLSYLFLLGFLALGVRVLLQLLRRGDAEDEPDEEDQTGGLEVSTPVWLQRLIVAGIAAATLLTAWLTWMIVHSLLALPPPPADATGGPGAANAAAAPPAAGDGLIPNLALLLLALLGAALLVLAVLWLLRGRAAGDDGEMIDAAVPPRVTPELAGDPFEIDRASLERQAPRDAVITAFAGAQRMLAASGAAAQWEETSAEHVRRVGPQLPGAAPPALDHLLALYHEAKFSEHPISAAQRRDAIAALGQLRDALVPASIGGGPR